MPVRWSIFLIAMSLIVIGFFAPTPDPWPYVIRAIGLIVAIGAGRLIWKHAWRKP